MRTLMLPAIALLTFALGCSPKPAPQLTPKATADADTPAATDESGGGRITMKGSDTMVLLAQRWAEVYMTSKPGVTIQVTGGGSGTGIAAIIDGTTDIANSSRPMKDTEHAAAKEKGRDIVEEIVAQDALCVVVNAANTVTDLSMSQLKALFTGAVTNWKDVGGADQPVLLYSRESSSGTYGYFKEHVLEDADFASGAQTLAGTAAIAAAVAKDPASVGYGGAAFFAGRDGVRIVPIRKDKDSEPVTPVTVEGKVNYQVIRDLSYPISRYLYCYTKAGNTGPSRDFLLWILSEEGQAIVAELDYVPLQAGAMGFH